MYKIIWTIIGVFATLGLLDMWCWKQLPNYYKLDTRGFLSGIVGYIDWKNTFR